MKHIGIISEFNPFHNGHRFLLEEAARTFPEKGILCVMSGNFVQRGSFAIQEKFSRARAAVLSGADLVLELPFPFSTLSAEGFGKSALSLLARSGIVDTLVFGSENADTAHLSLVARRLGSSRFQESLSEYLKERKGMGYPAARQALYEETFGEEKCLSLPNSSLAIEYLLANQSLSDPLLPFAVLRKGEGFRSLKTEGEMPSATALRACLEKGERIDAFVPPASAEGMKKEAEEGRFPVSMEKLFPVLIYLLKTRSSEELSQIYGLSALSHRAKRFCEEAESVEDLVQKMKNLSFTDSRIRRALLSLLCQTPRYTEEKLPAFTQVLAANERGRAMLCEMKECARIPVFTKPAHALRWEEKEVKEQVETAILADEIYSMAFPQKQKKGFFLKQTPTII